MSQNSHIYLSVNMYQILFHEITSIDLPKYAHFHSIFYLASIYYFLCLVPNRLINQLTCLLNLCSRDHIFRGLDGWYNLSPYLSDK